MYRPKPFHIKSEMSKGRTSDRFLLCCILDCMKNKQFSNETQILRLYRPNAIFA